ncbi:hypothetical protein SKAU_G00175370 [Synaphobranchus kaupii]|uniref:Telomeric repeat-binding factor 2-interacting protein 1 n=1 Tax=Synaphobranchus kaupii TaxID=118154 RepID=A0A9Q1FL61_SYNKA|nr:hypothetical protein SKAU_G00175370 [Synaphobranchus kaupii]
MRFFLRPGATKVQLQPIISAGGGVVCKVQEPNAILLMDPEEINEVPVSSAPKYVSSQYILDCVEKNQQLEVDDYRFRDDSVQINSANRKRKGIGRMGYSAEEDAAIMRFVQDHMQEVCGNRLWQHMERTAITNHSWQSMKDRYPQAPCKAAARGRHRGKTKVKKALQPSSEEENTNRSPERTHPQPSPDPTSRQSSPERAVPPLDKMHPCALPGAVQSHSLAGEGNSAGREVDAPNVKSTGTNGQLVVTEQVAGEEDEQRPTPKKRKLGILERAVKEFEDLDESDDNTPDLALSSTTSADREGLSKEIFTLTSAEVIQENDDDDNNEGDDDDDNEGNAEPQPEKASDVQLGPPDKDKGSEVSGPAPKTSEPLTSKVHMFLFDQESQEQEPSQPTCDTPFTQAQLENAKQQLRYLMKESMRGLGSVTKALLKNSGDVQAALQYLLSGQQGYLWDPRDDGLLRSAAGLLDLQEKYGKVAVARRIAFLDIE